MNAPAKNVQRAANESDHRGFPRELHELVERRCRRHRALPPRLPLPIGRRCRRAAIAPPRTTAALPRAAHCRRLVPLPPRPPPPPLIARAGLAALRREASRELGTMRRACRYPSATHPPPLLACRRHRADAGAFA